ncbi:hypothetical protein WJX75_000842 [Coccomyxa subellipsoidea]|uniref:Fibronectin type-III domain-containing protein n=1 Tax=Coccomyxa subellipsoidea TaxID=248742 RepID=A0ABR2YKA7_9CHLO
MAERTETSVTLSMARLTKATGGSQLPKGCLWEMEVRPQSESAWRAIHSSSSTAPMTANDLLPGTKYVFRARAGRKLPDGTMEWGKYSEESFYATMGRPAAAAGQPSGQSADSAGQQPAQSKKGRRRDAAAASKKQPQKTEEEDMAEAKRHLKAEKEKEAAVKAAMDRAAADYHRETEKLAAQKARTEEMVAEKVRRSRMKARKKEEGVAPAPKGNGANGAPMTNGHADQPPPHRGPPVPQRSATAEDYSDAFGDVRRINPQPHSSKNTGGDWDVSMEEEMSIQEAIQLSLALEESERYTKEEAANRTKLQLNEQSFPSLNGKDHSEWEAWEDPDSPMAPTAKSAPPPPATAAPPPAYRESKCLAPALQTSDNAGSLYASGNRRMASQYTPYVPKPAPAALHVESPQTNGSGLYTQDSVIGQSRGPPPAIQPNGYGPSVVPNGHANIQRALTQRPGPAPQHGTMPNGQVPARQPYNPLNAGGRQPQSGAPTAYAPPASSQQPQGNAATPMAALFPHLFPNAAA